MDSLKKSFEKPDFYNYKPDFNKMFRLASKYSTIDNFVIIGRGGSTTTFKGIYTSLIKFLTTKKVYFVETTDPQKLSWIKKKCYPNNTLVIVISKSGETVGVVEDFFYFEGYEKLIITKDGTLTELGKRKSYEIVEHPDIGGRFSGVSETSLLPASLLYVDSKDIWKGVHSSYKKCADLEESPALKTAEHLYSLEKEGFTEVYTPIYSEKLKGFSEMITQLFHETVCKERKGQSFNVLEAPNSQHHTHQRVFGGRENIASVFIGVKKHSEDTDVSTDSYFKNINLRGAPIKILENHSFGEALNLEMESAYATALEEKIPALKLMIPEISPFSIGEFIGFWHYTVIYSALLRGVNPYNQPAVEKSKKKSFQMRKD